MIDDDLLDDDLEDLSESVSDEQSEAPEQLEVPSVDSGSDVDALMGTAGIFEWSSTSGFGCFKSNLGKGSHPHGCLGKDGGLGFTETSDTSISIVHSRSICNFLVRTF